VEVVTYRGLGPSFLYLSHLVKYKPPPPLSTSVLGYYVTWAAGAPSYHTLQLCCTVASFDAEGQLTVSLYAVHSARNWEFLECTHHFVVTVSSPLAVYFHAIEPRHSQQWVQDQDDRIRVSHGPRACTWRTSSLRVLWDDAPVLARGLLAHHRLGTAKSCNAHCIARQPRLKKSRGPLLPLE
jgi:hypothetical protein